MKSLLAFIILLSFLGLQSCGLKKEKGELILFEKDQSDYSKFINQKSKPPSPNLSIDKYIVNADYPIEIALYDDGKFYYNLPNLGDGEGTYKYEDGVLKLVATRKILGIEIDMNYLFTITRKDGSKSVLKFRDRFGNQAIETALTEKVRHIIFHL